MGKYTKKWKSKAKANAKDAVGKVDKAQTKLIANNAKEIAMLKGGNEDKYNINTLSQMDVTFLDMGTVAERIKQIIPIKIGTVQGVTDTTRIGDMITLKTIQCRYQINIANGAAVRADIFNRVRVLLFWDNQPQTTIGGFPQRSNPEWVQLLQSMLVGSANDSSIVSLSTYQNDQTPVRFQVLHDRVHTLTSNGNTSTAIGLGSRSATGDIKIFKSYKGRKISYNAGGNVALNRQLYFAYISDSKIIAHPAIDFYIKTTFTDH